ncbi:hypothetical protein JRO89_XS12G0155400 [Xanthoceras sorbifolium]|uniref:HSA domain-containing protein n=1 Tax=Xanthoceras sorbifolium TaxID=99658 RepID=A0ABQ8HCR5_9ROSI|nr:hypothetical protein JRO89_XS12G0155400 [Xanthoceras sorbifolium]
MASKGPRSKLDHETRARRQKALEAPREPRRPKTHWDHVLEEMVWLSKDFESERKWKLTQAKKVALRASKGLLDQATRGEKKLKHDFFDQEEEQRLRKVALNISKDVKKFWMKIEKLASSSILRIRYHGTGFAMLRESALKYWVNTSRYSTMLAENLVDSHKPEQRSAVPSQLSIECKKADENNAEEISGLNIEPQSDVADIDEDYDVRSEDESEDDEHTIEEDEALITEQERKEELEALHNETNISLEELLKRYTIGKASIESSPEMVEDETQPTLVEEDHDKGNGNFLSAECNMDASSSHVRRCDESNGGLSISENHLLGNETSQLRNSSDVSAVSTQRNVVYDFNDEQVGL